MTRFFGAGQEEILLAMQLAYDQAYDQTLKCRGVGSAAQTRASARQQAGWRDAYWGQCGVVVVLATSGQDRDYAAIGDRLVIEPRV